MKIMPLLFFLFAIQLSLGLYTLSTLSNNGNYGIYNQTNTSYWNVNSNYSTYNAYNQSTSLVDNSTIPGYGGPDLMDIFFNPFEGNNSRIMVFIIAFAVLVGAAGYIPFINRSDISMLSAAFIFIVSAGLPTIVLLYSFINTQIGGIACAASTTLLTSCFVGQFFGVIIAGPLAFAWVAACLEWWVGRPLS